MSTPTIKVGQGNWGIKANNLLGYANTEKKFTPVEFTSTRSLNTATRVNASGNIEIVNANIPRIDYFGGQAALLVEPSATNFVPSGTVFNSLTGISYTNVSSSPAVDISGTVIAKTATGTADSYPNQVCLTSLPSGSTTYTISRFFKYNGTDLTTSLEFNNNNQWGGTAWKQRVVISAASGVTLGTSTACTGSVENYGNGWYRVSAKFTTGATPSGSTPVTYLMIVSGSVASGSSFLTALPQLETGSVATSYIPTTTGSVTRNADVISVSGAIGQSEGTIYAEVDLRDGVRDTVGGNGILEISTSPTDRTNAVTFLKGTTANNILIAVRTNSTNVFVLSAGSYIVGKNKLALAYKSGETVAYVNGELRTTSSEALTFTGAMNSVNLGFYGSFYLNDRIGAAALYTTRLTNEQLQALTT